MLTRRALCAGAGALAITAAVPIAVDGLTREERRLMGKVPGHVTAIERAEILALLRNGHPATREVVRRIIEMSPEDRLRVLPLLEAELQARLA